MSPIKAKKNLQLPIRQVLDDLSKPQYLDLTKEKNRLPSTSTRYCSSTNQNWPTKNVVVVKNIVNNYGVPFSTNIPKNIQVVNPQSANIIRINSRNPNITISRRETSNQRPPSFTINETRDSSVSSLQYSDKRVHKP